MSSTPILPMQYGYEPVDLTQNPGLGIRLDTSEEKIERSLRVARWYYQAFQDAAKLDWTHTFGEHPEWYAPNSTVFWGEFTPPPAQPFPAAALFDPTASADDVPMAVHEGRATRKKLPGYGTVDGSFRAQPWENGVTFSMTHGGATPSGERIDLWEVNTFLIDDDGLLVHWDNWVDTAALDRLFIVLYDTPLAEVTFAKYPEMIFKALAD